jgi:threonine/homoserine/homoserine lactone efflux protein
MPREAIALALASIMTVSANPAPDVLVVVAQSMAVGSLVAKHVIDSDACNEKSK